MSSLTQLLASHDRLLILDAASRTIQVGILCGGAPDRWHRVEQEAGTGIFAGTDALLKAADMKIRDIGAFVFCEGPGSMLGIRTVAMAIRTWQVLAPRPCYACQSLRLAGHFEWLQKAPRSFTVIADARRDTWHSQPVGNDGQMPPMQRVSAGDLPAGELVMPENFRAWAMPPRPAAPCSYDLEKIFPQVSQGDHFHRMDAPDAFQHEPPVYKKWSAQIHSAVTADKK